MRAWRVCAAGALGALPLLFLAGPAGATIDGPCQAGGEIDGDLYNADEKEVEIPDTGTVNWFGSIDIPPPPEEGRPIEGWIKVDLPAPLPDQQIGDWENDDSTNIENSDAYDYELPGVLADAMKGYDIRVYGEHYEDGTLTCSGEINVKIDGGGIGNPVTLLSIAFTVIAVMNLFLAIRVKA
jgi:hypothetical protein